MDRVLYNQNQKMTIDQSKHWFVPQRSNEISEYDGEKAPENASYQITIASVLYPSDREGACIF